MKRALPFLVGALALLIVAAIALGAFLWTRPPELHGTLLQSDEAPRDFPMTSVDGASSTLADLRGKWVLLYFGYTFCPDVCPTTLADLQQMKKLLGDDADDVRVAMVTLDPERDTPERLQSYLSAFDPSFVGFWGELPQVQEAATRFGVFFEKNEVEGASGYLVDHTSIVSVLDPEGRLRYVFPYGVKGAEMASDMQWLMD